MAVHVITTANNRSITEFDFSSELKRATDPGDFKQKISNIINRLGFSDYAFFPLDRDWEQENDQRLLSTYPEEYIGLYKDENLYLHDMLLSYAAMNTRPVFSSQIYDYYCNTPFDTELTYNNLAIQQLNCSFGIFDSYAIPIKHDCGKVLFILSKEDMGITAFQKKVNGMCTILRLLSQAIYTTGYLKFPTLIKYPPRQVFAITPGQLRTLETFANNDISINEVANKLCISVTTAQQHIAAARKALHVRSNQAAIKRCIQNGLISYT